MPAARTTHPETIKSRRTRFAAALGAGALVCTGLVTSTPAAEADPGNRLDPALRAAADAAPSTLQTPFEKSGGKTWTTFPQAVAFYRQLDRASERVAVSTIGRTNQKRPLQLVSVGAPAPKSRYEAAQGSVAMYVCSVHGDENSGREACMKLARDLAVSTDAAVTRFLQRTTVLFINANPDGWVADTRGNADGLDINRDYLKLETPEGRAVTKVIRDWNPDVLNDVHEYGPRQYYDTDLLHLWPRNRNVDDKIHDLAVEMNNDYSAAQVRSQGYSTGIYGLLVKDGEPFLQVAGDGQGRILRNYAGLVNVVGMLSETANKPLNAQEEADPAVLNKRRVAVNYGSAVGSAQMVAENRDQLERETAGAARRNIAAGRDQSGVIYFGGQDDIIPTSPDEVEPTPMCGYQLTAGTFNDVRRALSLHDLKATRNADGYVVSLAQANRALVPLLFDDRSEYKIADGTPLKIC